MPGLIVARASIYFLLLLLLSPGVSAAPGQEYVIVVNKDQQIDAISIKELRRIFLGKTKNWPDGTSVVLVLNPSASVHADFSRSLLHKSPQQLTTYWRKRLYSGKDMMPYMADSTADLSVYLSRHKNAISYINRTDLDNTLKPLRIEE